MIVNHMISYPAIDPVAFDLGVIKIHWYGISYVVGFLLGWYLLCRRARFLHWGFSDEQVADLVFYVMLGILIGGRLGYVLFYNFYYYIQHPFAIFNIGQGGMSFHGGLLGTLFAMSFFAYKIKQPFFKIADFIAPVVPIGLGAGRLGNFINGELWGAPSTVAWAMIFPQAGDIPRHPSQLYESFLEGFVLFMILWFFSIKPRPFGTVSGLFLMGYGLFRFIIEFVREPDPQIGYLAFGWLTMGQLLSLPMILFGTILLIRCYQFKH